MQLCPIECVILHSVSCLYAPKVSCLEVVNSCCIMAVGSWKILMSDNNNKFRLNQQNLIDNQMKNTISS